MVKTRLPKTIDERLDLIGLNEPIPVKSKVPKVRVDFNHNLLSKAMQKSRKAMKFSISYAAEACGIDMNRYGNLERGYKTNLPQLQCKFTIHEVLSVCLALDLNLWDFTIMPVQMSVIDGSVSERRDRAWSEAQTAWQENAELRELLRLVLANRFGPMEKKRARELVKMKPVGTIGVG